MDGAIRGKLGLAGIGSVLHNFRGEILCMFSKHVGIKESNEAEVLAILKALWIFSLSFHGSWLVIGGARLIQCRQVNFFHR